MKKLNGACHCRMVQFEVTLPEGLDAPRRCSCTYCRMRGGVAVTAQLDGLRFVQGQEALTLYQFNTMTAKHYFCAKCGIYTHHQRRSNPDEFGISVACLEGVSPFDFAEIVVNNGVIHPSDDPSAPEIDGVLRFERNT